MKTMLKDTVRSLLHRLPPRAQGALVALHQREPAALGPGVFVHASVQMLGRAWIRVGANSVLSQDCWLNVNHRTGPAPAIDIGANCFIGRRNFFSSGRRIVVGSYVLTANDCHFLGSSHVVTDPMRPCLGTGTTDTDEIVVGHNTFIGAGARLLGNVTVGHGCVVGAGAMVTRSVPPFSQVAGFPATVRRRFSVGRARWVPVDEFTAEDQARLPDADTYLATLQQQPFPRMPYMAAGSDMGQC